MPTPKTRLEKWLAKIAGESVDIEPKDRLETLLAKIAGDSVTITPDDSLEYWLNEIAENGGGGGSSDFSTATVTIGFSGKNTTGTVAQCGATLVLPNLGTPTNKKTLSAIYYWEFTVSVGGTGASMPILVPLYQGRALISMVGLPPVVESGFAIDTTAPIVTTGDIDQTQDGFVIRGNGTITFPITYGDK